MAKIVRGAYTSRLDLTPQSAGLYAISLGPSHIVADDHEMLRYGLAIHDAPYAWCKGCQGESHNWSAQMPDYTKPVRFVHPRKSASAPGRLRLCPKAGFDDFPGAIAQAVAVLVEATELAGGAKPDGCGPATHSRRCRRRLSGHSPQLN